MGARDGGEGGFSQKMRGVFGTNLFEGVRIKYRKQIGFYYRTERITY